MSAFWDFIDNRLIVRRIMTLGTFFMVMYEVWWSLHFAETSPRTGGEIAMILGAIGVPLNGLMGFLFASYAQGRAA